MTKIFISHSTADAVIATKLVDLLHTQFNLDRDENFFFTSDEELTYGGNWIEQIRKGMEGADLVLPIITPNYIESKFCLCELGATWVNQQALLPVIIPPLDYNALSETPYRSWVQSITLKSTDDLFRLAQEMQNRNIGKAVNMPRFNSRAKDFFEDDLMPYIASLKEKEIISPSVVRSLKEELKSFKEAYEFTTEELKELKKENAALRNMKDAEEIKELDYSKLTEWDGFIEKMNKAGDLLDKLHFLTTSILYHYHKRTDIDSFGFVADTSDKSQLTKLENEGYIKWDDGYQPDFQHPNVRKAYQAIEELDDFLSDRIFIIQDKFDAEYDGIRLSLKYSPFWEKVLGQTIQHSNS